MAEAAAGYEPVADVIVEEQAGEAFLLHVATGRYFGLNPTGLAVWHALQSGRDPLAAVRDRSGSAAPATVADDVAALLDALLEAELVRPLPAPTAD
ncbi:hypothetical protein BH20ACT2_BH20ACT2_05260 [soil metagenome]